MKHLIVAENKAEFIGWPANSGVWIWGDEIVVGYHAGEYQPKDKGHSIDFDQPQQMRQSRSLDGGLSWQAEGPFDFDPEKAPIELVVPIDFASTQTAIRCANKVFHISRDRCHSWSGPYAFTGLAFAAMTSRTDYLAAGPADCLFFLSAQDAGFGIKAGSYADRAFCARTRDGGKTFSFEGWMLPAPPATRSVMPATVRTEDGSLVSVLRRRLDETRGSEPWRRCWIDAVVSKDEGKTWNYMGEVSPTADPPPVDQHNGNPPALVHLADGRFCIVYGYRSVPFGMRYRTSADAGKTWSAERIIRTDARTWDFGYPRAVALADGSVLAMYYYTTAERPNQHIAGTIFRPE